MNWPNDVKNYVPATASSESHDSMVGRTLGVYEIRRHIGSGGMGDVYEGFHPGLERAAALKVINPELAGTEKALARFEREARSAALIRHPNAITIYDFGMDHGRPYLAMELMEGEDLESVLAWEGKLDPRRFLSIFRPACEAVHAAHGQRVIHRDLKPSNIFIDRCGAGREVIKVMDFGLAWLVGDTDHRLTGKSVVGTPSYIAPEQLLGHEVGPRSDVYALGVIAFQCLTGALPFIDEGDIGALWENIASQQPPIDRFDPWAYPLAEVVGRALSKMPSERQASALEFSDDLADALEQCVRPPSSMSLISAVHTAPAILAASALPPGLAGDLITPGPAPAAANITSQDSVSGAHPDTVWRTARGSDQVVLALPDGAVKAMYALAAACAASALFAAAAAVAAVWG